MMAQVLLGFLLLAALALIGLYYAIKEDTRREKEKPKIRIPEDIERSLDEIERKIS